MKYRIAVLGDFNPAYSTHHALNESIKQCNNFLQTDIQCDWIGTKIFNPDVVFNRMYSGLWVASGSPYQDMENVISAIHYSRINNIPTFGNCAGFQHMLIEFARNVCGLINADHEETNPLSEDLVITKLSCSLVEAEEYLTIIDTGSKLFNIIKEIHFKGKYFCNYGVNRKYINVFTSYGCRFTAISGEGDIRAFELNNHPFFLGTLFQPALTSTREIPNPVLIEFFKQCMIKS
jgi:CTP synthase (UTP-ammonia lyase)